MVIKMKERITEQVSIIQLDSTLKLCPMGQTPMYQLEEYYTPKQVYAIANYSGKYSYGIGTIVDVQPIVTIKKEGWLTNMIMNECLANIR